MFSQSDTLRQSNAVGLTGRSGEPVPADCNKQKPTTNTNSHPTCTSIEPSFLIDGLGLDPMLFEPPIHFLPPELLSYIFEFNDPSSIFPTRFSWTVTHVCRRWREIAFATPSLWSTVALDISSVKANDQRLETAMEFLDTCLALSKELPLDFAVALQSSMPDVSGAVLGRLCAHAHRWRKAHFVVPTTAVLEPWKSYIQNNTPILQSFGVGSGGSRSDSTGTQTIFTNSGVVRLVLSCYQSHDVRVPTESWSRIVSLRLISCAFQTLPSILAQLPNLRELELEGDLPHSAATYWGRPLELPNLLVLRATGYLHHISKLLPALYTPSLLSLSMTLFKANFLSFSKHHVDACIVQKFISGLGTKVKEAEVVYIDRTDTDTIWDRVVRSIQ